MTAVMASSSPLAWASWRTSASFPSIKKAAGQKSIQVTASAVLSALYSLSTAASKDGIRDCTMLASAPSCLQFIEEYMLVGTLLEATCAGFTASLQPVRVKRAPKNIPDRPTACAMQQLPYTFVDDNLSDIFLILQVDKHLI
jgi:hypothetical protein